MIQAIVYTSYAGHTKEYAELLSQRTGLPVYESRQARAALKKGARILYLGWLMAGSLKGCKEAVKRFSPAAVCAVGMSEVEAQREDIRKRNGLGADTPLFCLQGGFEMEKLSGLYKFMMKAMRASVGKQLSAKPDRTPAEEESLEMLLRGKNCVSAENLAPVLAWYEENER